MAGVYTAPDMIADWESEDVAELEEEQRQLAAQLTALHRDEEAAASRSATAALTRSVAGLDESARALTEERTSERAAGRDGFSVSPSVDCTACARGRGDSRHDQEIHCRKREIGSGSGYWIWFEQVDCGSSNCQRRSRFPRTLCKLGGRLRPIS